MSRSVISLGFRHSTLALNDLKTRFKIGDKVILSGWVGSLRKQKQNCFIGLKDAFGQIQVVTDSVPADLRLEDVVTVTGTLQPRGGRPDEFELHATTTDVENSAKHPLPLGAHQAEQEQTPQQRDLSLKFRYLDLRLRPFLQRNLRIRGVVALAMRNYLTEQDFLEVETPTLFKSTPEGAREFLVPVEKTEKDTKPRFYALVQSPQQYKQMLMVGGIDRYFQFARCYRDEGGRADRQPEFTQLDMEMSFVRQGRHIEGVVEGVVCAGWSAAFRYAPTVVPPPPALKPFPYMKLEVAMRDYGSDKPNLTFDMKINPEDNSVTAPNLWGGLSRREKDDLKALLKKEQLADEVINHGDDLIVRVKDMSLTRLGRARTLLAQSMKRRNIPLPPGIHPPHTPIWITDFGMFESAESPSQGVSAVHHPFTAPHPDDLPKLVATLAAIKNAPGEHHKNELRKLLLEGIRALHYDLVCDGVELGGGSIRIHSPVLQAQVFQDALGLSPAECNAKFGHLLEALSLGAPPHGGFALGFDRFIATLCGSSSISDTLAFPKATSGTDPLTGAPCPLSPDMELAALTRLGLAAGNIDGKGV